MENNNRIVALIDMDCFYCQVEEKINPDLKGKPIAVVQYNEWKGGGIIAVNYLARARGVTRFMRGDEARELCPDIALPRVPCVRGKADISKYRDAGKDVALVLQKFTPLLERASIDEAYLDVTQVVKDRMNSSSQTNKISSANLPNTFVLGYPTVEDFISEVYKDNSYDEELFYDQKHSMQLLVGAVVISEIRAAVYEATGYQCSAGIAHNKIMSKLVCGMNKPNKQTLLPLNSITSVYESLPLNKIKSLGGKFGVTVCDILKISKMKDLIHFSEKDLQKLFEEKNGSWLYNIARGIDNEPVTPRFTSKSIGCCKKFPGKNAILTLASLTHWLSELGDEIEDRLKTDSLENNRWPTQMVVSFTKQLTNGKDVSCSRSINVKKGNDLCGKAFAEHSLLLIKKDSKPFTPVENQDPETTILTHPIKYLGISVGKFEELTNSMKGKNIVHFFGQNLPTDQQNDDNLEENVPMEDNDRNQASPILERISLNITEKRDTTSTKLSTQESFFIKYFKGNDKFDDPATNLTAKDENVNEGIIVSEGEGSESHKKSIGDLGVCLQHKESILDEECNSDDSECTIDLEINQSKLLSNCEDAHSNITARPSVPRNFFSSSKSDDRSEEISDEHNTSFILCNECSKNIPATEFSVHSDYHVALALRQEERRSIQKPIVQSALVRQEQKKKKSSPIVVNKTGNIASFFGKSAEKPVDDNIPTEKCFECGKHIKLSDFSEHLDYHEAKKLSIEINKPLLVIHSTETSTGKRKRDPKEDNLKKNKKDGNKPNISSFFKEK